MSALTRYLLNTVFRAARLATFRSYIHRQTGGRKRWCFRNRHASVFGEA
jgi:hypothetical protein